MSISYTLFDAIRSFDNVRRENREEFLKTRRNLERFKGSSGYTDDLKKAKQKRKSANDLARENARKKINECLKQMKDNASKVAFNPPTPEQVAILQVLSMKSTVTRAELDRAAQSMNGNSLALSALNDIASKHYYVGNPDETKQSHNNFMLLSTDLSGEATDGYISSISKYCSDILRSGATSGALNGAIFNKNAHGIDYDEDDLPQRGELVSERQFYGCVVPDAVYDQFMKAVNG